MEKVKSQRPRAQTSKKTAAAGPINDPPIKLRPYAVDPFWDDTLRTAFWIWARQKGKSTTAASRALRRCMEIPGLTSIFGSASIRLGQEFIRKEAQIWLEVMKAF